MIAAPWNLILTVLFVFTLLVCIGTFTARRRRRADTSGLTTMDVIDLNHATMSIAMIVMVWFTTWDAVVWAQIAIFAVFTVALLPALRGATAATRVDLIGHISMNAAMIWMLAAMPLLMAGMGSMEDGGGGHAGHGGGGGQAMLEATPAWADAVNGVFIALSALAAAWWLWRLVTVRGHRLHIACHMVMAAGMGIMLALMNGV